MAQDDNQEYIRLSMPTPNPSPPASLYDRLGGRPALQQLLKYFYADVRQHAEIAPIFAANIEDWPAHLEKIADFWSGVTGGPALYAGPMPFKHTPLGLEERHFQAWLGLWARHCRARLAPAEAEELIAIAETIGQRLRQLIAMYGGKPAGGN
jgi:hemoglobin